MKYVIGQIAFLSLCGALLAGCGKKPESTELYPQDMKHVMEAELRAAQAMEEWRLTCLKQGGTVTIISSPGEKARRTCAIIQHP